MYLLNLEYPFNFNKSCIWIYLGQFYKHLVSYLTLTRVVFELVKFHTSIRCNILFNFNKSCIWILEDDKQWHSYARFNFNKSCIWINRSIPAVEPAVFNFNKSCIWITYSRNNWNTSTKFNFNKSCIWILTLWKNLN